MRIGEESDPDSDVLQLVAGVKKKMLCQPLACMHCAVYKHACMHTSVFQNAHPSAKRVSVWVCALQTFDVCMCAHVHDASKP